MKIQAPVEIQEEDDTADFLARLEQVATKKLAKKFSTIQRDEADSHSIQIAVPTVDKAQDEITPQEYAITTIDLSPTTKGQEVEELDNFVSLSRRDSKRKW